MKQLFACLACIALLWSSQFVWSQEHWRTHYDKAVVATFYSASAMNGHDELEVANLYLDSARLALTRTHLPLSRISSC